MMKMKLFKMTATAALLGVATSASAQLTLVSAWDFEDGPGSTTSQATLGAGQTWNQVTNTNEDFTPATASDNFSTVTQGLDFGTAGVNAPGSSSYLDFGTTISTSGGDAGDGEALVTNVSGNPLSTNDSQTTFVAWVNMDSTNPNLAATQQMVVNYSPTDGAGAGNDLRFLVTSTGFRSEVSSGYFEYTGGDIIGDGWQMIASVFDGTTGDSKFYLGGTGFLTPDDVVAQTVNTLSSSVNILLGGQVNGDRPFVSQMDDVAVYNGAASLAELDAIYNNGIAIPEPGTLALVGLALGALMVFRRRH